MNEKIDQLRRSLQREATIMGRTAIKGTRYLLLRSRENLRPDQLPQLEEALKLTPRSPSPITSRRNSGIIGATATSPKCRPSLISGAIGPMT